MSEEKDSSTRTIAGAAAVIGLTALLLGLVQSSRTGLIAEFAGTANAVSQQNESALLDKINKLTTRVDALEKAVKKVAAKKAEPPAAPPADGE